MTVRAMVGTIRFIGAVLVDLHKWCRYEFFAEFDRPKEERKR